MSGVSGGETGCGVHGNFVLCNIFVNMKLFPNKLFQKSRGAEYLGFSLTLCDLAL